MRSIPTKEHIMSKGLIKLLPVAACLALSGVAAASTPKDLPSVVVKYGDLSLDTKSGVASLHARIRNAARYVCNSLDSRVLGLREQYEHCVSDAVKQSVAAVGNDNLSRYHRFGGRFGGRHGLVASN
jgi:UrcA family protein